MLEVHGLSRRFGSLQALDQVSFAVPSGGLTGFIGGNGAGKTTTMRIIMGVLVPDAGTVTFNGQPVTRAVSSAFGYMPEERGLYPKMKVAEQIAYLATLHGIPAVAAKARAAQLLTRLGLGERLTDQVEKLSLGNQQRAQIAAALAGDPSLLVLDEPFSGLDPLAVDTVGAILHEYVERGIPCVFSSHQLDLVERLCDHLVIIAHGQVRAAGTRDELLKAHAGHRWEIAGPAGDWLARQPGVAAVEPVGGEAAEAAGAATWRFTAEAPDEAQAQATAQAVLQAALAAGPVRAFGPWRPSLVEVFREVIVDEAPKEVRA
ncbi:MAG: ATP-binding cassette domain-containing protein [Propionibacteriaceae bacterium]|jgi:ABC-2 type transport system ATP-binding protein|nr:ATP-binding cassette domain-containing protein [Propionibacteriaceae bacterium]